MGLGVGLSKGKSCYINGAVKTDSFGTVLQCSTAGKWALANFNCNTKTSGLLMQVANSFKKCNGTSWIANTNKSSGGYAYQFVNIRTGVPWNGVGTISGGNGWNWISGSVTFYSRMVKGRLQTRIILSKNSTHDSKWVWGMASVSETSGSGKNRKSATATVISPVEAQYLSTYRIFSSNYR